MIKNLIIGSSLILGLITNAYSATIKDLNDKIIIKTSNVSHIYGEVNQKTYENFIDSLKKSSSDKNHLILINSPGGSVSSGQMIIDAMKLEQKKGAKFYCYVVSEAHSMAFNILSFCDVRMAEQNAVMLVHKVAFQFLMTMDRRLTAKTLRELADDLEKSDEPYRQQNSKKLGYSLRDYDVIADNDTMFTAKTLIFRHYLNYLGNLFIIDN